MSKPKNIDLPGMTGKGVAPVSIPEINKAAERYVVDRDERQKRTKREVESKTNLIEAMHNNAGKLRELPDGSLQYCYDDMQITVKPGKEEVKVRSLNVEIKDDE